MVSHIDLTFFKSTQYHIYPHFCLPDLSVWHPLIVELYPSANSTWKSNKTMLKNTIADFFHILQWILSIILYSRPDLIDDLALLLHANRNNLLCDMASYLQLKEVIFGGRISKAFIESRWDIWSTGSLSPGCVRNIRRLFYSYRSNNHSSKWTDPGSSSAVLGAHQSIISRHLFEAMREDSMKTGLTFRRTTQVKGHGTPVWVAWWNALQMAPLGYHEDIMKQQWEHFHGSFWVA